MAGRTIAFITDRPIEGHRELNELYSQTVAGGRELADDEVCLSYDVDAYIRDMGVPKNNLIINSSRPSRKSIWSKMICFPTGSVKVSDVLASNRLPIPNIVVLPSGVIAFPSSEIECLHKLFSQYPQAYLTICHNHF